MRRGRLFILIGLLLIVGVGAVFVLTTLTGDDPEATTAEEQAAGEATQAPAVSMGELVLAVQDMSRGSEVVAEAIAVAPWPLDQLPPSAIFNPEDAVGLLVRRDIKRGEPILESMLVENALEVAEAGSDWALFIPEGRVAISLPAPRLSGYYGSNLLRDGDHVNILVSFLMVDLDEDFQTILPNITVPVALTDLSGAALGTGGEEGGGGRKCGCSRATIWKFRTHPGWPQRFIPGIYRSE